MLSKKDGKKAMSLHIRILAILSEHMSVYFCQILSILVMTSFILGQHSELDMAELDILVAR